MKVLHGYDCEFCGQVKPLVSTPFGVYCKECFGIMIDEYTNAIDAIEQEERK